MKVQEVTYSNFMEVVKDKINLDAIKNHAIKAIKAKNVKTAPIDKVDKKEIFEEIKRFLKKMNQHDFTVTISFHQKTKAYVIKVIDNKTKQVVREAPLEKILDMISFMKEFIKKRSLHRRV